ncbi:MAG: methyltransferase domain-containing protein, partial [Gammaproteobacteria bacterium]|nr:methyltransferase domain-containing protein [Gammaproteobacteria bacterium]
HLNQPKEKFPVGQNVISDFLMLPFKESSIDLIICPHLHEMVSRPEQLYAELSRITVAGGILIMFSLNTKSIWSMQRLLRGNKILPWCHLMCSQEKLSLSLRAHDFMLIRKQSLYHMPYVENNIGKKLLGLVGNFGERWWSSFGAINVAVYKKMELIGAIESAEQPLPHTH